MIPLRAPTRIVIFQIQSGRNTAQILQLIRPSSQSDISSENTSIHKYAKHLLQSKAPYVTAPLCWFLTYAPFKDGFLCYKIIKRELGKNISWCVNKKGIRKEN